MLGSRQSWLNRKLSSKLHGAGPRGRLLRCVPRSPLCSSASGGFQVQTSAPGVLRACSRCKALLP